jgi:hypothetical protein
MEICPKCNRPLPRANAWHYCAEVDMDDLFKGKKEELILIFDKLLCELVNWPDTLVSATKNCIVFVRNKTFLVVRPMKTQLDLKFYLEEFTANYPVSKSVLWNSKYETHIRLKNVEELDALVFKYLRASYRIS